MISDYRTKTVISALLKYHQISQPTHLHFKSRLNSAILKARMTHGKPPIVYVRSGAILVFDSKIQIGAVVVKRMALALMQAGTPLNTYAAQGYLLLFVAERRLAISRWRKLPRQARSPRKKLSGQ
jgi:hypothetical protein